MGVDDVVVHRLVFDRLGRLVEQVTEDPCEDPGVNVSCRFGFGYDRDGRRVFMDTPVGRTEYSYGPAGDVVGVSTPAGGARYRWDECHRLVSAVTAGGVSSWRYEGGVLVEHTHTTPDSIPTDADVQAPGSLAAGVAERTRASYTYDAVGRVVSVDSPAGLTVYSYDEASQLVGARTITSSEATPETSAPA